MRTHLHKQGVSSSGVTLIESLFYVGILGLLVAATISTLVALNTSYENIKSASSIESAAQTALDRMVREIRSATSVDIGNSTLNASPGRLTLQTTDAGGAAATVEFLVSSSTIRVRENGVDVGPLTSSAVRASSVIFRHVVTPLSEAVRVELVLESGQGDSAKSKNFYATAVLRNSYPID